MTTNKKSIIIKKKSVAVASGATTSIERLTPTMARALREKSLGAQRPLNKYRVAYFRSLMEAGKWSGNIGAPVAVLVDEKTKDGNHRLESLSECSEGTEIDILVTRNLDPELVMYMDNTPGRTIAHMLKFAEVKVSDFGATAALAKVILNYQPPGVPFQPNKQLLDVEDALGLVVANVDKFDRITTKAAKISNLDNGHKDPLTNTAKPGGTFSPRVVGWFLWQMEELDEAEALISAYAARQFEATDKTPSTAYLRHFAKPEYAFSKGAESQKQVLRRMAAISGLYFATVGRKTWKPWNEEWKEFPYPSPSGVQIGPMKK